MTIDGLKELIGKSASYMNLHPRDSVITAIDVDEIVEQFVFVTVVCINKYGYIGSANMCLSDSEIRGILCKLKKL